jgi:glucosamine-phosphate N-acetyltransferase
MNSRICRPLTTNDYTSFLALISQFRPTTFTKEQFCEALARISLSSEIYVIEQDGSLVATATVMYETKYIFNICTLAHVEDVCVAETERGKGLGKELMRHIVAIAKSKGCYKVTLDCADSNVDFYTTCNFEKRGHQMTVFFS